jgi:hydrogenase maturation factor
MLMAVDPHDALKINSALVEQGITCAEIGWVEQGPAQVWQLAGSSRQILSRPARDEIARLFERR